MNFEARSFWGHVFATNRSALHGFLRRRVSQSWDIQDIAQEAYLRMLRIDAEHARKIADPRAYLFTVAANLAKEHALMQKRNACQVDIEDALARLEAPRGSAEDEAERTLRRERLTRTLNKLPSRCRAVLIMQHRDGMSYEEIARHFGVSTHMVKKYVVRALLICRNDLAREE
ncbi:MAG: RNA polymerase sigma factor [Rhodanobacteraceae bacterium]